MLGQAGRLGAGVQTISALLVLALVVCQFKRRLRHMPLPASRQPRHCCAAPQATAAAAPADDAAARSSSPAAERPGSAAQQPCAGTPAVGEPPAGKPSAAPAAAPKVVIKPKKSIVQIQPRGGVSKQGAKKKQGGSHRCRAGSGPWLGAGSWQFGLFCRWGWGPRTRWSRELTQQSRLSWRSRPCLPAGPRPCPALLCPLTAQPPRAGPEPCVQSSRAAPHIATSKRWSSTRSCPATPPAATGRWSSDRGAALGGGYAAHAAEGMLPAAQHSGLAAAATHVTTPRGRCAKGSSHARPGKEESMRCLWNVAQHKKTLVRRAVHGAPHGSQNEAVQFIQPPCSSRERVCVVLRGLLSPKHTPAPPWTAQLAARSPRPACGSWWQRQQQHSTAGQGCRRP